MEWWWIAAVVAAAVVVLVVGVLAARGRRRPSAAPAVSVPARPSAAARLRQGLLATRERLSAQLEAALRRGGGDTRDALVAVEEALVASDVGVRTAATLVQRVRERSGAAADTATLRGALREEIASALAADDAPVPSTRPWVVMVVGVNGVGKTTTVGKLAALHAAAGRRVLMVAGDTFRAAAVEQLAVWAERTGAELVRQGAGASPAAVVFDGVKAAVARSVDVVIIDTAGRLHTRSNLMEELRKVQRVVSRELPGAPHETLLVLDATTGQNGIAQARTFSEALGLTGAIVTKLDGTARGGVALAVRSEIGVPVRYVGVGESADDLRPLDPQEFARALVDEAASPTGN
ncbi:MAG TPA: signal recognition particle-docking protein FtsY [Candidatus Binatia bacterium]|nr:signal recognition particle-docking protein FtsY [Candidatus Binatia bacterium]